MNDNKISDVMIDQHQLFREGLKKVLESDDLIEILASSVDISVVNSLMTSDSVDVLLLDIHIFMKNKNLIKQTVANNAPRLKVIIMSSEGEENMVTEAIKLGVDGYILKEMDVFSFIDAILSVAKGHSLDRKSVV